MKLQLGVFFFALLSLAPGSEPSAKLKIVSKAGKSIEVEVIRVGEASAKVRKADGKEFEIGFDQLEPGSVENLKKGAEPTFAVATEGAADRPLPKGKAVSPADLPEKVVVKAGEKIVVTFTLVASGLTKPVIVKGEEGGALHFSVEMKERKPGDDLTLAMVEQTFSKILSVKCLARNKGQNRYYETSIIDLPTGLPDGESWGDEVEELVFYDFAWAKDQSENKR